MLVIRVQFEQFAKMFLDFRHIAIGGRLLRHDQVPLPRGHFVGQTQGLLAVLPPDVEAAARARAERVRHCKRRVLLDRLVKQWLGALVLHVLDVFLRPLVERQCLFR